MARGVSAHPRLLFLVACAYGLSLWGSAVHRACHAAEVADRGASASACAHGKSSLHLCASAHGMEAHAPDCALCATGSGRFGVLVEMGAGAPRGAPTASLVLPEVLRPSPPDFFSPRPRGPPVC